MGKKKLNYLLFIGLVCVAVNLRAPITAVGPLVPFMKSDLPFSNGVFGLLTTIPLIMFAVFSPFVRKISDALGAGKTLLSSIAVIAFGIALRSYAGAAGLFLGTVLLGAGVAIGNVLIPGIIKSRFPERVGLGTSAFTLSMTSFAAVSSAVSYPLSTLPGMGWRNALAVWIVLAALGFIIWWPHRALSIRQGLPPIQTGAQFGAATAEEPLRSVFRSPMAWWLTVLMGAQSFLFYFFAAWLPSIALDKGIEPTAAGYIAFIFQLSTIPAAFFIPTLAAKRKDQRGMITLVVVLYLCALSALFLSNSVLWMTIAAMFYGFATGVCFNLCILLISLKTRSAVRATSLSGMVQSIGYGLGAVGPLLGGWLFDRTDGWNAAFICVAVLIVTILFSGRQAGQDKYI